MSEPDSFFVVSIVRVLWEWLPGAPSFYTYPNVRTNLLIYRLANFSDCHCPDCPAIPLYKKKSGQIVQINVQINLDTYLDTMSMLMSK